MQRQIVEAVQQELTRFSAEVATSLKKLSEDIAAGAAARADLDRRLASLTAVVEQQAQSASSADSQALERALDARLSEFGATMQRREDDMNTRLSRVVDEAAVGIAASVESAAHPVLRQVEHRQDKVEADLRNLDASLRSFDQQAGQMVNHINQVTAAIDSRLERVHADVQGGLEERMSAMVMRVDEVSAIAARQQVEVSNIVGDRVDATETRINERLLGLESRVNEQVGQRVADIDAHVGRIGQGLDEAVTTISDRITANDARFSDVENELTSIREGLADVDADAIEEIKDKVSSALGQAELVRIEMDRFQETMKENLEKTAVRLTEIETTVQDQSMDVETAVQLERLEEVERAVLMLDPDIIASRNEASSSPEYGTNDDATLAMLRPQEPQVPVMGVMDAVGSPSASAPLSPPTAEPTVNTQPAAPVLNLSMSLDPPVN